MRPRSYRRKRTTSPSCASATVTAPSRSESSFANRPCASRSWSRIGSTTRIQLSEAATCGCLEPRHELGDRALDRDLVVGLHVRGRALRRRPALVASRCLERGDRRRHAVARRSSNPSRRHAATAGSFVVEHLEASRTSRTALLRVVRARCEQRLRDALPARARADVDELDVRDAALRRLDARRRRRRRRRPRR